MGSLEMVDFESWFRQKGQFAVSIIMRSAGPKNANEAVWAGFGISRADFGFAGVLFGRYGKVDRSRYICRAQRAPAGPS